jgi:hypothetical protein
METLNVLFHWLVSSPGYFFLGLIALVGLFGMIGGINWSRSFPDSADRRLDEEDLASIELWWKRDERNYEDWNAHQVREQHRIAQRR